jgi:hypothetical protein
VLRVKLQKPRELRELPKDNFPSPPDIKYPGSTAVPFLGKSNLVLCLGRSHATAVPCDGLACKEFRHERRRIRQRRVDSAAVILARIIVCLDPRTSITSGHEKIVLAFRESGCVGQACANEDGCTNFGNRYCLCGAALAA